MQENSLWLGRMRAPIKTAMIGFVVLTVVIYALLIGQRLFLENAYGMYEMIRPAGKPLVQAMLVSQRAFSIWCPWFWGGWR